MKPIQGQRVVVWLIILILAVPVSAKTHHSSLKDNYTLGVDSARLSFRIDNLAQRVAPPLAIIGISALQNDYEVRKKFRLENSLSSPAIGISDYLQYSPGALMLGMKMLGVDGRSDWNRMIVTDAVSLFIMVGMVNGLKYSVCRERPDGSSFNSYPSGHTATSFMTATMLHKEYGQTISPWFSAAGYTVAASVGVSRVLENRHWISDIICGAGIGILSTELAYDISGALFGDKHLLKPELAINYDNNWSFSLRSHFCFNQIRLRSANQIGQEYLMPGYSLGMEATRALNDHFGFTLTTYLSQLRWTGSGYITLPDQGNQTALKSIFFGGIFSLPLIYRTTLSCQTKVGFYKGESYLWKDSDGLDLQAHYPTVFCSQIETGLNIRTSKWSGINAYIGMERYGSHFIFFFTGTGISLYL